MRTIPVKTGWAAEILAVERLLRIEPGRPFERPSRDSLGAIDVAAGLGELLGARSSSLPTLPPADGASHDSGTSAAASHAVARAIVELRHALDRDGLPLFECARAARSLVSVDSVERRSVDVSAVGDDLGARMIGCALAALSVGDHATHDRGALEVMAIAAMLQPLLDLLRPLATATARLGDIVESDLAHATAIVVAHDALRIRRGQSLDRASLHARLVALACEEARPSLVEIAGTEIEIPVDLEALEGDARDSIESPDAPASDGKVTLATVPLAKSLATLAARRLSGTLLLQDPHGLRHAIVLMGGMPVRARTRIPTPTLGTLLVEAGDLNEHLIPGALSRAGVAGLPLGVQLVADELVTPDAIEKALLRQHLHRIAAIARLPGDTQAEFWFGRDLLASLRDAPPVKCEARDAIGAATT